MLIRSRIRQTKGVFAITDGVSTSVFSFGGSAGARPSETVETGGEEVWHMVNVGLEWLVKMYVGKEIYIYIMNDYGSDVEPFVRKSENIIYTIDSIWEDIHFLFGL